MVVTLDGQRLEAAWSPAASLQALVNQVRHAHLHGRVVVDLSVNGQALIGDTLERRLAEPLSEGDSLELISAAPAVLAGEALRECAARLDRAADAHVQVAETLQAGRVVDAVQAYSGVLGVWHDCQETLRQCGGLIGRDLSTETTAGLPLHEHLAALARRLREVRDTFENRDFVLLADLLQYEMPDVCRTWSGLLNELAGKVQAEDQPPST